MIYPLNKYKISIIPPNKLFRTAGIYILTNTLNAAIPFLMMPLLTRYLTPHDYGIFIMFQMLITFVASFTGLSINGAIGRQYVERDAVILPVYIANCLLILMISSCIVIIFFIFFSEQISRLSSIPKEWFWAVIVVAVCQFLTSIVLVLWQMKGKPFAYGLLQMLQTIINIGLSLMFVVIFGLGWQGSVLGQTIAVSMTGVISLGILWQNNWLNFTYDSDYIRHALRFGVPLIPHTIGATVISMIDRLLISNLIGVAEAGIYAVGYQVGMIIALMQNSFNQAWVPWVYEKLRYSDNSEKITIVKFTYLYFAAIIFLAIALSLFAPWFMTYYIGKNFSRASNYVFWIGLAYAFNGMYKMVSVYIFYESRTHLLAWITFLTAAISTFSTYHLILLNGAVGAAQASSMAFFISFVITWFISARIYKMPWNLKL